MSNIGSFSILYPNKTDIRTTKLSETACHDLGLDNICKKIAADQKEQRLIMNVLSEMTPDPDTAFYRQKVFADLLRLPQLRKRMTELFDKVEFIRSCETAHRNSDEKLGLWHLMHRLEELNDYIKCVEEMKDCLSQAKISSEGLIAFREHVDMLYNDALFADMKKDIAALKTKTSAIQSVTIGINVNERFEAISMGLVSVNDKPFKKSGIISNFADAIASKNKIHSGSDWNGDMHYHLIEQDKDMGYFEALEKGFSMQKAPPANAKMASTVYNVPEGGANNSTFYLENVINKMLDSLVKKLSETLTKYASVAVVNISQLIPEFIYYIRMAEFVEACTAKGFPFCEARLSDDPKLSMSAKGFYNLKLAISIQDKNELVDNDLDFTDEHTIYILTGANRGGKTTVTQAVGIMFVLAQGGVYVPATQFVYRPADSIYTHFPADEDKTMDLGRLGEECIRFKEIYNSCTKDSLLLMNETFSTTSFEEGYYIAKDSVRALMQKGVRTIFNTHMHKLAADTDELNSGGTEAKAASLIVKNQGEKRSFKLELAPPEGMSYAMDIAKKYGVTFDMLVEAQSDQNSDEMQS